MASSEYSLTESDENVDHTDLNGMKNLELGHFDSKEYQENVNVLFNQSSDYSELYKFKGTNSNQAKRRQELLKEQKKFVILEYLSVNI